MNLNPLWKSFDEREERHKGDHVIRKLPAWTDPITFAKQEWEGFDWLSTTEDRGAFLTEFWKDPHDSIIMGAKETAKSLTLSVFAIELMLYSPLKTIGIIAGSEDQAKVTYAHLKRLLLTGKHTPDLLESEPREIEVNMKEGRRAWVYASSYYRAHGEHPHVVIADEAVLASKAQGGEVLKGALASVTTGGVKILASAPYYYDKVFMPVWVKADEMGYRRYGPWRKHPWEELVPPYRTEVNVRPWLSQDIQVKEALRALTDPNSKYRVFWIGEPDAGVGDVFPIDRVEAIVKDYDIRPIAKTAKALGVDTGFGSSMFGVVGVEERDGKLFVLMAEEYERPNFNDMAYAIARVYQEDGYDSVFVDASNPAFIEQLTKLGVYVESVSFSSELRDMISYARSYVESGDLLIHEGFPDLIQQLKDARWAVGGTKIDKTGQSFDELDALMCSLRRWSSRQTGPIVVS